MYELLNELDFKLSSSKIKLAYNLKSIFEIQKYLQLRIAYFSTFYS